MEKIELASTRDLGQLIGDPFLFIRQNIRLFLTAFLYCILPPLMVSAALAAFGLKSFLSQMALFSTGNTLTTLGTSLGTAYGLSLFVMLFQQAFVSQYMVLYEKNKETTLKDTLLAMKGNWKLILVTFLAFIPLAVIAVAAIVLLIGSSIAISKAVAGFLAFILYLFLLYSLVPLSNFLMVRLRERLGLLQALVKCFKLANGYWWKTFTALFVLFFIFYCLVIILVLPFQFLGAATALHSVDTTTLLSLMTGPVMGIYLTIVSIWTGLLAYLFHVFTGINYFNLSEGYDNYHLQEQLLKIGDRSDTKGIKQEGEF